MIIENNLTKCPNCKRSPAWVSHVRRWEHGEEVEEFAFTCEPCQREYLYKDNEIVEKRQDRDPYAEARITKHSQLQAAANRLCVECGGPMICGAGSSVLHCRWCH